MPINHSHFVVYRTVVQNGVNYGVYHKCDVSLSHPMCKFKQFIPSKILDLHICNPIPSVQEIKDAFFPSSEIENRGEYWLILDYLDDATLVQMLASAQSRSDIVVP